MSFPGGSTPSLSATASSSSINTTIVASSTPQLVVSTITSSAPALSLHLAASRLLFSPIFPPRMVSPSLVLRRLRRPFRWFCQLCLRPYLQRCLILIVSLLGKLWGHRSLLVSYPTDCASVASIRSSASPTDGHGSCCTRKPSFSRYAIFSFLASTRSPVPG